MSSSIPTGRQNGNQVIPLAYNSVRATGYPANVGGPYVFVSPVLVPYVEAPKHFGKGKSKKTRKSPAKVRYIPALLSQPAPVIYNQAYNPNTKLAPPPVDPYSYTPYAMSISPDAHCFKQGYISALSNSSAGYYVNDFPPPAVRSDLNPYSRPYTPANRSRVDFNASSQQDELNYKSFWAQQSSTSSECSSPELWGESVSAVTSRAPTPVNTVCAYCRGEKQFYLSDADSGVGGESDEDGILCTCDVTSSVSSDYPYDKDPFDIDFKFHKKDVNSFSKSTQNLIEFLSSNLQPHEWRTVARELGVDDVIIQSADYDDFDNLKEQMNFVFCIWAKSAEVLPHQTNRVQVTSALREIGRFDLISQMDD